jgi:transcriptional regulator with XRE-family HTH domain
MPKSVHTREYAALRAELKRVRESAGLSQRDLAAALKVAPSWVANVETGERRIDLIEFCWFITACGEDPRAAFDRVARQTTPKRATKGGRR